MFAFFHKERTNWEWNVLLQLHVNSKLWNTPNFYDDVELIWSDDKKMHQWNITESHLQCHQSRQKSCHYDIMFSTTVVADNSRRIAKVKLVTCWWENRVGKLPPDTHVKMKSRFSLMWLMYFSIVLHECFILKFRTEHESHGRALCQISTWLGVLSKPVLWNFTLTWFSDDLLQCFNPIHI